MQEAAYEAHSLNSLSQRILIGRAKLAEQLRSGAITPLPGSHDRSLIFTTAQLSELREQSIARLAAKFSTLGLNERELALVTAKSVQFAQKLVDAESAGKVVL